MMKDMDTKRNYLAFDIETAKVVEDASAWKSHRPLGISCAATLLADSDELILWHGGDRANPNDGMSQEEAARLAVTDRSLGFRPTSMPIVCGVPLLNPCRQPVY
jgi:hypothetical protein